MGCTPYCTPLLLGIRGRMKIHLHELMYLIGRIYFTIKKQLSKKITNEKITPFVAYGINAVIPDRVWTDHLS